MKFSGVFLLILIVLATISSSEGRATSLYKWTVKFINELGHNKDLQVHCKSGDDDKGNHWLRVNETYSFGFHVNFFGTTLYFCSLMQGPKWQYHQIFDAFTADDEFVAGNCDEHTYVCTWLARDDGIYSYNGKETQRRHEWLTSPGNTGSAPEMSPPMQ